MLAFDTTSNKDQVILREVWKKLDERFGMCWFGPSHRLMAWKKRLFPETSGDDVPPVSHKGDFDFKYDAPIS